MYSNPLTRKYQDGGQMSSSEMEQVMQAFYQWLPTAVKEFQGMEPTQVEEAIKGMVKTSNGKKQVETLLQQFQQAMESADQEQTGIFKKGGKLHDFICKHATGGRAKVGCGCHEDGGIISAQDGTYLTRGEAFRSAMDQKGLTRDQTRHAYWSSKNALRANGLRGSELRQAARQMIAGQYPPQRESVGLEPVPGTITPAQVSPIYDNYAKDSIGNLQKVGTTDINANAKSALDAQMAARYGKSVQQRVQDNWNNQSFDTAFGNARKLGQKTFSWRDRLFGTRLASTPEEKAAWARSRNIKLNPQNTDQDQTATSSVETPATEQSVQERQYTSSRELPLESQILGLPTDGVYPLMDDYRSNWLLGTRSANTDNNVDNSVPVENTRTTGGNFLSRLGSAAASTGEPLEGASRLVSDRYNQLYDNGQYQNASRLARNAGLAGVASGVAGTVLGAAMSGVGTAAATSAGQNALIPVGQNAVRAGKAAYTAPYSDFMTFWRGADGQWIGKFGDQLVRNGSLYYPLATLKTGGKISWLQNGGLARAKGYYARHANEGIIRKIQNFLMSRGYNVGDLDGKFGPKTYEAIRQYQRDNGLKDDGMWGEDTNLVHRVLGAGETTFNGPRSGAHPGQHTFNEDFKGYRYSDDGKTPTYSDINKIIERGIKDPNWFWGDSSDAKRWRVYFEQMKDGKGQQILETIYNEVPDNLKSKISYSKLPTSLQQKRFNDTTTDTDKAAGIVGATLSAPLALTNPVATAGAILGGYAGGNAGEFIGSTLNHPVYDNNGNIVGWRNANEVMHKDTAGNFIPTVKPDKSSEGRDIGTAIGTVLGAAGADAVSNLVEIEPGLYNPTGIELKLEEPVLKPVRTGPKRSYVYKTDWRPTPPKNNFPKTAGGQYTVGTPGDLYVNETGLNSTLKCGGKVEKHQQQNNRGRGKIAEKTTMLIGPSIGQTTFGVKRPWISQTVSFDPFTEKSDTVYFGKNVNAFDTNLPVNITKKESLILPQIIKNKLAKIIESDYSTYRGSYPNNIYEKQIDVKYRK